jgi:uncharacterized protein
MAPKQRSAAKEILLALDADPALIEHYDPNEIEAIPLASIHTRLVELGLTPTMPVKLQRIILESTPSPAADVLRVLADDFECVEPQDIEAYPLDEVTACLRRVGFNYRACVTAIIDLMNERTADSVCLDKDQTKVRPIKPATLRSRKYLFLVTIASTAAATAAVAATVGFFVTKEARQDKVIADQWYEIQELSAQLQGLEARLKELRTGADDFISLTMLVPPSNPLEHRTWPPLGDDSTALAMSVGVAPEASLGGGSSGLMAAPKGIRSPANIAAPVGVALEQAPIPGVGTPRLNAFQAFQKGARALQAGDTRSGLEALEYAARNGEVMALWKLGRMYADGDDVKQSDQRAFEYFRTLGNSHAEETPGTTPAVFVAKAFVEIGGYYLTGIANYIKPDADRAHQMFSYAASYFGDPDAQYRLGRMYLDGQGAAKDPKQAARWLSSAAGKGQYQAQAVLGAMLFKGESVPRDAARGLMYLILARDAATPKETWITDLYNAAFKQATRDEQAVALIHVEHWIERYRSGRQE